VGRPVISLLCFAAGVCFLIWGGGWKKGQAMRLLIPLSCFAVGCFFLVNGCSWTSGPWRSYAPAPLTKRVEKRTPVEDFVRLRKLFKAHGGDLISRDDKVVKWKDSRIFRMFEFKHHTVIIFPYNWIDGKRSEERFALHMFAGHAKDYSNLYTAFGYDLDPYDPESGKGDRYRNTRMNIDVTAPALQEVGFEGFRLGEPKSDAIDEQLRHLREECGMQVRVKRSKISEDYRYVVDLDESGKECGSVASWDDQTMNGWRWKLGSEALNFDFWHEDGRLSYMHFFTVKCPLLGDYSIYNPVLPVLEQGEFEIPAEE